MHLVCVTKYRRSVFTAESLSVIEKSFQEVAERMDFQVQEFNGESNHICSPPLEIGVRSQEPGARRKEEEGRRKKKCFYKYEMLPYDVKGHGSAVSLQISPEINQVCDYLTNSIS